MLLALKKTEVLVVGANKEHVLPKVFVIDKVDDLFFSEATLSRCERAAVSCKHRQRTFLGHFVVVDVMLDEDRLASFRIKSTTIQRA